ncbi:MAG: regulatory protein RecX [Phycisphaerales bacterium]|nr:regulatory protein RecX [Phycisphaerales bacterium]
MTDATTGNVGPTTRRITAIRPLPSDPSRRSILVDNRVVARLRETDVIELGLKRDDPWTEERAAAVARAVDLQTVRHRALTLLGKRAMTSEHLRDRLVAKNFEAELVTAVIDELIRDGWLDDAAYGRELADTLVNRQRAAASYITHKLEAHRIDPLLAEELAADAVADVDAVVSASELIFQNHARWATLPPHARIRRAAGLLSRRGYDEDVVSEALRRCGLDPDDVAPPMDAFDTDMPPAEDLPHDPGPDY